MMKKWELAVKESKKNLWLVTTMSEKILCKKVDGEFYIKSPLGQLIDSHYVTSSEVL